jgi:protein SMG7
MISSSIVLSQAALWKIHDNVTINHARDDSSSYRGMVHVRSSAGPPVLEVGKDELRDLPPIDSVDHLGQRITATFRQTLTAPRIVSQWLRAN